ncbi:MAG: T9SS type A sorting domain-containing protein [Ignavibacteria bacterium]
MKVLYYLKSSKLTILSFQILLLLFTVSSYSQSGWFSQPLPVNGQVNDLKFINANTGLISMDPAITLRTINGGFNWLIILPGQYVGNFEIIDTSTVYANGMSASGYGMLLRSYDLGISWDSLPLAGSWTVNGLSFVNRDTGWVGGTASGLPFLWRTTNAGVTWNVQSTNTGFGKVFFLKNKVNGEYVGWSTNYSDLWKTTNSGVNWIQIQQSFGISKLYFLDENIGYVSAGDKFKKTTNGGLNWNVYNLPNLNYIVGKTIADFEFVNKDTIYGDNGIRFFDVGAKYRGIIWISTNGGVNWNFQQPDTSFGQIQFTGIDFANKDTGWSLGYNIGIRTNDGGGPIIITGINNQITTKPELFILEQNYPNPFNSSTRINFSISRPSFVSLNVYDITGKEVLKVYNYEFFTSGNYYAGIDIGKMGLSSGVYIYRMRASDIKSNNVFEQSRKLVYVK